MICSFLFHYFSDMLPNKKQPIILFDGVCNLCNNSVKFILRHDKKEYFFFASLQSDASKNLLLHYNFKNNDLKSIIVIDQDRVYEKSEAILIICKNLGMPWALLGVFRVLPKRWLDLLYDFVAKNRYKWFGKKECCTMTDPAKKNRFIQ
jgi:predicted DCC family thiol-disulfide oxidoreductase YuxK